DHMRIEEGSKVTIVRLDLKKMYVLDTAAKTASTVDLPLDMKKLLPPEVATNMEQFMGQTKFTVTPTQETKKVGNWNATPYTLSMAMPMGNSSTREIWVTKDAGIDVAAYQEMYAAFLSATPVGASLAGELKKIDGLPVLVEEKQSIAMMKGKEVSAT